MHEEKAQVAEKLAAANGEIKQLKHEVQRIREHEQVCVGLGWVRLAVRRFRLTAPAGQG